MNTPTYTSRKLVTFGETNALGNVYFVNYLRWQGEVREEFIKQYAPSILRDIARGLRLLTVHCSCDYYQELRTFDEIEVRMYLTGQEQNRLAFRFDYIRQSPDDEEMVARGAQEIAFVQQANGEIFAVKPPRDLSDALLQFAVV